MTEDMVQNRSLWHMKTKAGPHGGGLLVRNACRKVALVSYDRQKSVQLGLER